MVFITYFNNTRQLEDIKDCFDYDGKTNINYLLEAFEDGMTTWSVAKNAEPGDIVVFMCAKEARNNLGMATSHIPPSYSDDFRDFVKQQKALYKQYCGCLLGYGIVDSVPVKDDRYVMSDISYVTRFLTPIHIDDFRCFIKISRTNSITYLKDEQWERLKWVVNQKNPGLFQDTTPPDIDTLNEEFEDAVQQEEKKSISALKKKAEKEGGKPSVSSVQTKVYYRNAAIAAYVKKRANGCCQLCGQKAPFMEAGGEPYLECHHINWLSKGGLDSVDNCVALCPNCHRKMHIVNDPGDVAVLKSQISTDK